MSNNYDWYKKITLKFSEEEEILNTLKIYLINLQSELNENKKEINILDNNNNCLNKKINTIINNKIFKINIFIKLLSIIFIISTIILAGILSNLNVTFMTLFSTTIPFICIYINSKIVKSLKIKYYKKSKRISRINYLIKENNDKITKYKLTKENLNNKIDEINTQYNNQKDKVYLYKNIVEELKNSNSISMTEQKNGNNSLKRTR